MPCGELPLLSCLRVLALSPPYPPFPFPVFVLPPIPKDHAQGMGLSPSSATQRPQEPQSGDEDARIGA